MGDKLKTYRSAFRLMSYFMFIRLVMYTVLYPFFSVFLGRSLMAALHNRGHYSDTMYFSFLSVLLVIMGLSMVIQIGLCILHWLIEDELHKKENWARRFAIALAIVDVFSIPVGPFFAVYTLFMLFRKDVKRLFTNKYVEPTSPVQTQRAKIRRLDTGKIPKRSATG